jgi:hypothetical protein
VYALGSHADLDAVPGTEEHANANAVAEQLCDQIRTADTPARASDVEDALTRSNAVTCACPTG